ncbi:MAG TPA: M48 family metallopeptidase [Candidatus Paceibacterota bacterium]|jgi:heat shock protein HtpX|nr:M48 family metallopeptidase [Candidatus Pacearchaeota archaeon]HPZ74232.1 M48 family metallopeptidase [Candidatus Pacearchaeota archaeon]HQD88884.1 M48 family metallopeptidase [Candidatus Pacearchaeota archaeon]HRR39277.1 M48 family metallopeptidase [Candidatus Paceibacterota bacterium]
MSLYSQAEANTQKTFLLIIGFCILLIGFGWLFSYIFDNYIILIIATVLAICQSFFSYWYSDKIVLSTTKAKPIEKKDNPELYRIIENLSITAGLPMPKIYILNESQPNAFATGRDKNHAVIVVTQGLLEKLERSEIEGVIAHELSHIGNKDILLSTVVVILVGIIAILSDFFLRISFWGGRRSSSDESKSGIIMFALGILAAILAPIAASLLQLAISRKREFLADATGALLTRYPEGLARALEKISDDPSPLKTANTSNAHLFISSPFKGNQSKNWLVKLFSTHPPVEERIKALREMTI